MRARHFFLLSSTLRGFLLLVVLSFVHSGYVDSGHVLTCFSLWISSIVLLRLRLRFLLSRLSTVLFLALIASNLVVVVSSCLSLILCRCALHTTPPTVADCPTLSSCCTGWLRRRCCPSSWREDIITLVGIRHLVRSFVGVLLSILVRLQQRGVRLWQSPQTKGDENASAGVRHHAHQLDAPGHSC